MSPEETLKALRRLSQRIIKQVDESQRHHTSSTDETLDLANCMAENFKNLDQCIVDKGFLPKDWQPKD